MSTALPKLPVPPVIKRVLSQKIEFYIKSPSYNFCKQNVVKIRGLWGYSSNGFVTYGEDTIIIALCEHISRGLQHSLFYSLFLKKNIEMSST